MGGDVVGRSTKTEKAIINTVTLANQDGKFVYTGVAPYPKTLPLKGDRWIEFDSNDNLIETWVFQGSYWLSVQPYFGHANGDAGVTLEIPLILEFTSNNLFLNKIKTSYKVNGTISSLNYWKLHFFHVDNNDSLTRHNTIDSSTASGNVFNNSEFNLNSHVNVISSNTKCYMIQAEKIRLPANIRFSVLLSYQKARR